MALQQYIGFHFTHYSYKISTEPKRMCFTQYVHYFTDRVLNTGKEMNENEIDFVSREA